VWALSGIGVLLRDPVHGLGFLKGEQEGTGRDEGLKKGNDHGTLIG
jgi:hypothetical protein